eukprot:sb/3472113/
MGNTLPSFVTLLPSLLSPCGGQITNRTCKRRVGGHAPILLDWVNDGVVDCEDGADEDPAWPACGEGPTKRYKLGEQDPCQDVFLCGGGGRGFKLMNQVCDKKSVCGNEGPYQSSQAACYNNEHRHGGILSIVANSSKSRMISPSEINHFGHKISFYGPNMDHPDLVPTPIK